MYSNWAYDYYTLWQRPALPEAFARSLVHYQQWATLPSFLYHVHHVVAFLGFTGLFLKLYKPSESNKLFDGASLFLYMVGIVIYLTNLRIGVLSAVAREWGDVDEETGINVIAASQVMIVFTFLGVVGLQVGQYWAEVEDKIVWEKALQEEKEEIAAAEAAAETAAEVKTEAPAAAASGSKSSKTKASKRSK